MYPLAVEAQRTRSSSAQRARYSLVQLDLVLHLSYARFHYLSFKKRRKKEERKKEKKKKMKSDSV